VGHGLRKKPLHFGGIADHITVRVTVGWGQVIPRDTASVLLGVVTIVTFLRDHGYTASLILDRS